MIYSEDELLPLSALSHLKYCERRAALIHLEGVWLESRHTVEGRQLHERADLPGAQSREGVRVARGLMLRSLRLGLSGKADVVEFHRVEKPSDSAPAAQIQVRSPDEPPKSRSADALPQGSPDSAPQAPSLDTQPEAFSPGGLAPAIALPHARGLWRPFPVEYKRGEPKDGPYDRVQICAQALCLEEMLGVAVPAGALFYGVARRRLPVEFSESLRREVEEATRRLHRLFDSRATPPAVYDKKCRACSLREACLPRAGSGRRPVARYLQDAIRQADIEEAAP